MNGRGFFGSLARLLLAPLILLTFAAVFTACSDDDDPEPEQVEDAREAFRVDADHLTDGGGPLPEVYAFCDPATSGFRVYVIAADGSGGGRARAVSVVADPNCGGPR